jgi:amino acid adenylation domain-containing protein
VRIRVGDEGAEQRVLEAHRQLAELLRHEHASLALAQRCSAVPAPTPLFSSLLNYAHSAGEAQARSEEKARAWEGIRGLSGGGRNNYPVTLSVDDLGEDFLMKAQVESSVDANRVCEYMRTALESLVEALESEPSRPLRVLEVMPEAERRRLLYEWNATQAEYPREKLVHELFEEQAEKTPEACAVVYGDQRLSYRELNTKAERLARYLAEAGIVVESRVGIYLGRSVEMMVGALGVMKAGATYVPLEPGLPKQRVEHMMRDAGIEWVLVNSASVGSLPIGGVDVVLMDGAGSDPWWLEEMAEGSAREAEARPRPENLAYILYTSGSTGKPKGVMATHRGLSNYVSYAAATYLGPEVRGSVVSSPLCFDATLTTLLPPLLVGKAVELLPEDETTMCLLAERLFGGEEGWLFKITPAHLEALEYVERPRAAGQAPHRVVVGGEQLGLQRLRRWKRDLLPAATFVNEYGPTEAVVGCSVWTLSDGRGLEELEELAAAPIGRPIANTRLYVLGEGRQPQPCNSVGELYIGGEGLARGYLNLEELTRERFIANPFSEFDGGRLYRTGDLARWLPSGELAFVGRRDDQVKIRGYRIELGEVEACLAEREGVGEAVVIVREDAVGDRRLVAYYTCAEANGGEKEGIGAEQLRTHLSARLPEYMVPAAYVRLDRLPLTPNGKVDRKELPAPEGDAYGAHGYEEPVGETERALAEIWAELLKLERVGRHDNFFELGGNSLLILRFIARMRRAGWRVDPHTLFTMPVLAELAAAVDQPINVVKIPPNRIPEIGVREEGLNKIEIRI